MLATASFKVRRRISRLVTSGSHDSLSHHDNHVTSRKYVDAGDGWGSWSLHDTNNPSLSMTYDTLQPYQSAPRTRLLTPQYTLLLTFLGSHIGARTQKNQCSDKSIAEGPWNRDFNHITHHTRLHDTTTSRF